MISKFAGLVLAISAVSGAPGAAFAGPAAELRGATLQSGESNVVFAAAKVKKPRRQAAVGGLKAKGRVVKDTCPANNQACIDDLVKNCDKAGGGLSTWPDGSVDCYVVGIHDQP